MLIVTAASASVLAVVHILLSLQVIGLRRRLKVSVGDGGHSELERAIRCQANLVEYAPIALVLMLCLELAGVSLWLVGTLGLLFVAGRIIHPLGLRHASSPFQFRVGGMHLTLWSILAMALLNVFVLISRVIGG